MNIKNDLKINVQEKMGQISIWKIGTVNLGKDIFSALTLVDVEYKCENFGKLKDFLLLSLFYKINFFNCKLIKNLQ